MEESQPEPPIEIFYRGIWYKRNPNAKQRAHRVYYSPPRESGYDDLHREIWRDNHPGEEIPKGWHIHHDDHDPFNNDPCNLVLRSPKDHGQEHKDEFAEARREHMDAIRPLAAEWHASDEGHAWHVEHGRRTWEDREPAARKVCESCHKEFDAWFADARYCSRTCINRARERKYLEAVICPVCGRTFKRDRYRKRPETCSPKCGWVLRKQREA